MSLLWSLQSEPDCPTAASGKAAPLGLAVLISKVGLTGPSLTGIPGLCAWWGRQSQVLAVHQGMYTKYPL